MNKFSLSLLVVSLMMLGGCGEADPDAPPQILLGDSVCVECGMIVSDERFGTATIIEGERGPQSLIFDDFNCQKKFELKHPQYGVVTRWSRDYNTLGWFRTSDGYLAQSPRIRSPMASRVAGFAAREDAAALAHALLGVVITYESYDPSGEP